MYFLSYYFCFLYFYLKYDVLIFCYVGWPNWCFYMKNIDLQVQGATPKGNGVHSFLIWCWFQWFIKLSTQLANQIIKIENMFLSDFIWLKLPLLMSLFCVFFNYNFVSENTNSPAHYLFKLPHLSHISILKEFLNLTCFDLEHISNWGGWYRSPPFFFHRFGGFCGFFLFSWNKFQ